MSDDGPPPTWVETLARAGVALVPDPVGGAALAIVVDDVIARHRAKAREFAEVVTGGSDNETLRSRMANDRVGTIVGNAGEAAVRSAVDAKRRALARVARNAIDDDAKVDEAEIIVQVLGLLESPHIGALSRLAAVDRSYDPGPHPGTVQGIPEWSERVMKVEHDRRAAVFAAAQRENPAILALLGATGLVAPGGGLSYNEGKSDVAAVTPLGHLLLSYLDESEDGAALT